MVSWLILLRSFKLVTFSPILISLSFSIPFNSFYLCFLQRNLREMVLLGLSAKREKADRIQLIKNEVIEMIKLQVLNFYFKGKEWKLFRNFIWALLSVVQKLLLPLTCLICKHSFHEVEGRVNASFWPRVIWFKDQVKFIFF